MIYAKFSLKDLIISSLHGYNLGRINSFVHVPYEKKLIEFSILNDQEKEWLNEFVDLSDITDEQIAHELTMSGLEVEDIEINAEENKEFYHKGLMDQFSNEKKPSLMERLTKLEKELRNK